MFTLDYRLKDNSADPNGTAVFVESNEVDLRFRLALGDLVLVAPGVDLSTRWGWVPLIDLAAGLREVVNRLKRGGNQATFEFTESEATLTFSRNRDELIITASYAPGHVVSSLGSFDERLRHFERDLRADLVAAHPALDSHPVFNRLLPRVV